MLRREAVSTGFPDMRGAAVASLSVVRMEALELMIEAVSNGFSDTVDFVGVGWGSLLVS